MCYIVVVLRDMVKERWWSATDIKHRKHVKTCYLRDRVSLGFRDRVRVRVKDRVTSRLATFMYSVCPPVPHFPYIRQTPKILASFFNLPPNLYYV